MKIEFWEGKKKRNIKWEWIVDRKRASERETKRTNEKKRTNSKTPPLFSPLSLFVENWTTNTQLIRPISLAPLELSRYTHDVLVLVVHNQKQTVLFHSPSYRPVPHSSTSSSSSTIKTLIDSFLFYLLLHRVINNNIENIYTKTDCIYIYTIAQIFYAHMFVCNLYWY